MLQAIAASGAPAPAVLAVKRRGAGHRGDARGQLAERGMGGFGPGGGEASFSQGRVLWLGGGLRVRCGRHTQRLGGRLAAVLGGAQAARRIARTSRPAVARRIGSPCRGPFKPPARAPARVPAAWRPVGRQFIRTNSGRRRRERHAHAERGFGGERENHHALAADPIGQPPAQRSADQSAHRKEHVPNRPASATLMPNFCVKNNVNSGKTIDPPNELMNVPPVSDQIEREIFPCANGEVHSTGARTDRTDDGRSRFTANHSSSATSIRLLILPLLL